MRVFVAGASGALGLPLIAELIRQGHDVTGMTRSESGASKLAAAGARVAMVDALDARAVEQALRESQAAAVIDQLTALPRTPTALPKAAPPGDRQLRLEGGGNLLRSAVALGVHRYLQQASGFFLHATSGLADESAPLRTDAPPGVAASASMYEELEQRLLSNSAIEGVALRYGFFYGPGTWYWPDGTIAQQARRGELPVIGEGAGVWSFVHVDDAASATVAALTAPPGAYNIVDDDPSPVSRWLPDFAAWVGAGEPPRISIEQAQAAAGENAVFYHMQLTGASNAKAKRTLGFRPRPLQWLRRDA